MWEPTFAQGYSQNGGGEESEDGRGEGQTLLLVCRPRPHI